MKNAISPVNSSEVYELSEGMLWFSAELPRDAVSLPSQSSREPALVVGPATFTPLTQSSPVPVEAESTSLVPTMW